MLSSHRISPDPSACDCTVVSSSVPLNTLASPRPRIERKPLILCQSSRQQSLRLDAVWGSPACRRGLHWMQSRGQLHPVGGCTACSGGVTWMQSEGGLGPVGGCAGSSRGRSTVQGTRPLHGVVGGTACKSPRTWGVEVGALHRGAMPFGGWRKSPSPKCSKNTP